MDRVAPTGPQQPRRLGDHGAPAPGALHGEHRLTDHHIRAGGRERGGRCVGDDGAPAVADDAPHRRGGVRVGVDADVRAWPAVEDVAGGAPQAGRKLDDVRPGQAGPVEQGRGERSATGTQDPLAEPGQQPVTGDACGGTVGRRQGRTMRPAPSAVGCGGVSAACGLLIGGPFSARSPDPY